MKKLVLLLFILAGTTFTCLAQQITAFSWGVDLALPTGQAANIYDYSAGFSAKIELSTGLPNARFIATAGFAEFLPKKTVKYAKEADYAPLEAGAKFYINHALYLEGDVGASINLNSNYTGQRIGLIYAPTLGYTIPVLDFDELDLGLRYEGRVESGGTISQVALRVAYKFNL